MKGITTLFLLFFVTGIVAQPPKAQLQLEWFQEGHILQGVSMNKQGDELVFVKRLRSKEAGTATAVPAGTENLVSYGKDTSRLLDPVIAHYDLKSRRLLLLDYGWAPRFSPNSRRVVYAHQEKPLNGARVVAESLKGNGIRIFEFQTKKVIDAVTTTRGFLMDPVFTDSASIIYKTGDAVNGPYAAGISLHRYNLLTKKTELLYGARIRHRLYDLMGDVYGSGSHYAFTVYSPQDSAPGLANEYSHLLMRGQDTLHNFGIRHYSNLDAKFALLPGDQLVYLDDNHLMAEDTSFIVTYQSGNVLSKKPLDMEFSKAWLSPEGRFLFYTNNEQVFILRIADFTKLQLPLAKKEIHSVVWSDDGHKVAVVQDHDTLPHTDKLYLFSVN
ncbi:hypothetical protein LQ567_19520 [Niabella pedocola]|uniref:Dipeptidylpeptidase IV N-terminal domain-containing protein n=1 Tax=Niabella pedocola TaxID=1752077 RepID=A0ABS8PV86_9BACT|nr:hypothetical protein [Niabella pedocola]MCD2424983.1 hypothetical protein [Niabella pedocola]